MRRLRILTWHVHGNYLYYLTQVPHDFYIVADAAPVTASLVFGGVILWMLVAVPLGILSALTPCLNLQRVVIEGATVSRVLAVLPHVERLRSLADALYRQRMNPYLYLAS